MNNYQMKYVISKRMDSDLGNPSGAFAILGYSTVWWHSILSQVPVNAEDLKLSVIDEGSNAVLCATWTVDELL